MVPITLSQKTLGFMIMINIIILTVTFLWIYRMNHRFMCCSITCNNTRNKGNWHLSSPPRLHHLIAVKSRLITIIHLGIHLIQMSININLLFLLLTSFKNRSRSVGPRWSPAEVLWFFFSIVNRVLATVVLVPDISSTDIPVCGNIPS